MIIDTHIHLYSKEYDADRSSLIEKAIAGGIKKFYLPNIDSESLEAMLKVEKQFSENCFPMIGIHPCSVNADSIERELKLTKEWLNKRKFAAIGEIGLDLYWDKTFFEEQKQAFKTQIQWAVDYNYPIVIHCREAFEQTYEVLKSFEKLPKAIFHCFSGNTEQANKIIALGNFKLGIGGVVTFKNSGLDKVVNEISLEHLVLETDGPYLAPAPFRGKRNEPAYILEVAKKIAEIKELSIDEIAEITTQNAEFIFNN